MTTALKEPSETGYRYLVRDLSVRSGEVTVEGTRIGVHDVVGLLQNGEDIDTLLLECFPELTRAQVYSCLSWYEDHRGEIDVLIARQMAAAPVAGARRCGRLALRKEVAKLAN